MKNRTSLSLAFGNFAIGIGALVMLFLSAWAPIASAPMPRVSIAGATMEEVQSGR